MKDQKNYQMASKKGDIVMLPNGIVGIVTHWDIVCGGNCKEIEVYPFTNIFYRLWLLFTDKLRFCNEKINDLKLLISANPL